MRYIHLFLTSPLEPQSQLEIRATGFSVEAHSSKADGKFCPRTPHSASLCPVFANSFISIQLP
jgi:hypothetical protein